MKKAVRVLRIFFAIIILSSLLAAECHAINLLDRIIYKEVKLRTNTKILVHRLNGQVGYYWQSGKIIGDPDYDPEANGAWKVAAGNIKARLQQQYNEERR